MIIIITQNQSNPVQIAGAMSLHKALFAIADLGKFIQNKDHNPGQG